MRFETGPGLIRSIGRVVRADARSLELAVPGWPGHRPGQFAMLSLDPGGLHRDPLLGRPMAVFRGDSERLEFRFRVVGRGTALLAALPSESEVGVVGPLGNGFPLTRASAVLVGGGTGIASLYELAVALQGRVRVLLGGRTRHEILGLEEFRALAVELEIATEDGSLGHRGLVTDRLELKPGEEVFACGPAGMMRRASELAKAAGSICRVSLERTMACGFGICLGCAVRTATGFRYVCTDGPVFVADELVWEEIE